MATDILPRNALGIKILHLVRGALVFNDAGDVALATDTSVPLVLVKPEGLDITSAGAELVLKRAMELELSHREWAILREFMLAQKLRNTSSTSLTAEDSKVAEDAQNSRGDDRESAGDDAKSTIDEKPSASSKKKGRKALVPAA